MFMYAIKRLRNLITGKEEGASLAEYGLLVALIAVICVAAITALGGSISAVFTSISGSIDKAL